jgi:hypothetical protein
MEVSVHISRKKEGKRREKKKNARSFD